MPRVSPFDGLVFDPAVTGTLDRVTAPPYDVISEERRQAFLDGSPYSIVHLDLSEGPPDPEHPSSRYARAARLLNDWEASGVLVRDRSPRYRAYEMRYATGREVHTVRGLVCAMELEPWGGQVIPHEHTMPGPLEDRLSLLRATHTHLSAVYGTVAGPVPELTDLLEEAARAPAPWEAVDEQGVRHRVWTLRPDPAIAAWLAPEPLLIADGHHRYTTALAYREERHAAEGPGPWDRVLTFVVDAASEDLTVLPFHRVQILGSPPDVGEEVPDLDAVDRALSDGSAVVGLARRAEGGTIAFRVVRLSGEPPAVRALHAEILDALPAGSLRFVPDRDAALAAVRSGEAVAAWLLPPTTPDRIRKVIERGERLPQKSTYFWPKPRTGMVMMPLSPPPGSAP